MDEFLYDEEVEQIISDWTDGLLPSDYDTVISQKLLLFLNE